MYRERDELRSKYQSSRQQCEAARRELEATRRELEATRGEFEDQVDALLGKMLERAPPLAGERAEPRWRWGKQSFFEQLPRAGTLLDVGCGNNSPSWTKQHLPEWRYVGLDIGDYNQTEPNLADEYILTTPERFCDAIELHENSVDVVVSSHNLEHCFDRSRALLAMARSLRSNGRMYLSFPCHDSVDFPGFRDGCLNYYDDTSHRDEPPDFGSVISALTKEGLRIIYATTRYQPPLDWVYGLKNEAESAKEKQTKPGTWAYWGFETIIWAEKTCADSVLKDR
ncbi:MAG TPA: methyltransferase domain-containing protein [Rhodoblastus sp.]|nr:methyltransferase domain-containing protein [Rhodoblastus sp.]